MERYEKYKDSGIEWIGDIPEHWKIVPIKRLVGEENTLFLDGDWIESKDIVFDTDGIRYITTGNIGEGIYKEQGLGYITQDTFDKLNCTEVLPFDLVISRLNPPIGRCCIIPDLGKKIVTSVDNVILRPNKIFNKGFLKYVMSNEKYFEYTSLIARGATMQRISRSLLGDINIPVSFDFNEQTNIATFLERKTTEIDRIIANKQKLITLYEEEKQAIINQAVTKGLEPNVKMKDSGVEWLGEIPEHWEVKKLKYIADIILGKMLTNEDKGGYSLKPYLRAANLQWLLVEVSDVKEMWFSDEELKRLLLKKNDILVSEGGEIGRACIWNNEIHECYIQNSVHKITVNKEYCPEYVLYSFYIYGKLGFFESIVNRISIAHLTGEKIKEIEFFIPPFKEQQSIVTHIEKECHRLDAVIEKYNKQIDLLEEYRTTLISEVVTGKIKVID